MVENITSGVVSLDREGRVLMRNRVAAELLGVEVGEGLESAVRKWERLAPVAAFLGGLRAADRAHAGEDGPDEMPEMARATVRLPGDGGGEREWALIWVPVPGAGEPAALLVVEDATEVLRGQRLQAWAEMARIIAHEIKNPLTPIRLSAEHMREVYKNDPDHFGRVFDRCTSNILTQVEELRSIASEFSAYSAIPRIDPQPGDLTAAMAELVEGYRAAPPEGVSVELESDGPIGTRFDAKLLGRAVRNLLENALRATRPAGGRVVVRTEQVDGHARIAVVDSGPGVRPDLLPRIFDPYFSTHDTGTGLGLAIARRIAEEHGGDIAARNRPEGGLEVVVTLPIQG
jgi:two-component system nitrogen regulation sensor histidine kinase NtrY